MKYAVQFQYAKSVFRKSLSFSAKGELHLQETALILEGYLPKFTIPFAARNYLELVSEWSTRTIPFSRIVRHKYTGHWVSFSIVKFAFLLLITVLFGLMGVTMAGNRVDATLVAVGLGAYGLIVLLVLVLGRRTHRVTYLLPNGKKCVVAFCMPRPVLANSEAFSRQLKTYLTTAKSFTAT